MILVTNTESSDIQFKYNIVTKDIRFYKDKDKNDKKQYMKFFACYYNIYF